MTTPSPLLGTYRISVAASALKRAGSLERTLKKLTFGHGRLDLEQAARDLDAEFAKHRDLLEAHRLTVTDGTITLSTPDGEEVMTSRITATSPSEFTVAVDSEDIGKDTWACRLIGDVLVFKSLELNNELDEFAFERIPG